MPKSYIEWLKHDGVPLFKANGDYWRIYNKALVPASPAPTFVELNPALATKLLTDSGAWFIRYCSSPTEVETPWWYIVCDNADVNSRTSKLRNQIKYGARNCHVEKVDGEFIAQHGYSTYRAAHERYTNATKIPEQAFRKNVIGTKDAPVDYWGVFVEHNLAAYCQCTLDHEYVDITVLRLDPAYLKLYSSYALIAFLIDHYVCNEGKILSNGERSIAHQTSFQDFLLKFGFRKRFCQLNLIYTRWLGTALRLAFPFRDAVYGISDRGTFHKLKVLLVQEEIRRLCL